LDQGGGDEKIREKRTLKRRRQKLECVAGREGERVRGIHEMKRRKTNRNGEEEEGGNKWDVRE